MESEPKEIVRVAGFLPAPGLPAPQIAEAVQEEPTREAEPEQTPDLVSSLFGSAVVVAEPVKKPAVVKPAVKPAKKTQKKQTGKLMKFPQSKSLYQDNHYMGSVNSVTETTNWYTFMKDDGQKFPVMKSWIAKVEQTPEAIHITTK